MRTSLQKRRQTQCQIRGFICKSMTPILGFDQLDSQHDSSDTEWHLQPVPKIVCILLVKVLLYEAKKSLMFSSASRKLLNMLPQIVGLFMEQGSSAAGSCFKQFYGYLSMPVKETCKIPLNAFCSLFLPSFKAKIFCLRLWDSFLFIFWPNSAQPSAWDPWSWE